MKQSEQPLIICHDVALGYEGKDIVRNLNITINEGDYLCIIGDNGAGKSTLLKGLLGLRKPEHGTITMRSDISKNTIGYLPQQTPAMASFPATVYEVVLSGCLSRLGILPFYKSIHKETARKNMERLNISNLADTSFQTLSGGQKQRVLIARALCATECLLILDEPTTGLDPTTTGELYDLIRMLNHSYGVAIIMVSHDMKAVMQESKQILHLRNEPIFYGTTTDYLASDIGKQFLGGSCHV